jgi:hypothetical protein
MRRITITLPDDYYTALEDLSDGYETIPSRKAATIIKEFLDDFAWRGW